MQTPQEAERRRRRKQSAGAAGSRAQTPQEAEHGRCRRKSAGAAGERVQAVRIKQIYLLTCTCLHKYYYIVQHFKYYYKGQKPWQRHIWVWT